MQSPSCANAAWSARVRAGAAAGPLRRAGRSTRLGQAVEPARPVIVLLGRVDFGDEPGVLEPLDRFIERPGTEPHTAFGVTFDLLLDAVAVAVAVGKRQQDVQVNERRRAARLVMS